MVAVIDTDSFQVRDSQTGKVYRCTVGSEGFTPVELLGKDFSTTDQTEIHDRFRLAVLIHYLLFGYHPFSGEWIGSGDSPEQTELIRKGFWYGGNNSLIRPSLNTIPLDVVHPEIKRCFLKCFNDGHTSPDLRPTAEDWHNALEIAVNDLTVCGKVNSHCYSQTYGKCYWCERAAKLGVDIFPGGSGSAKIPTFIGSSNTAKTTVKTLTNPSTVIQTVPYSTPSNQTLIQPASLPSSNFSPTIPSSQPSPTKGLLEWQKAVINGSVIGTFLLIGLLLTREQPLPTQTSTQQSVAEQNISSAPDTSSSVESSHESVEESTASSDSTPEPTSLPTLQSNQLFSVSDFPKASCGDPLPSDSNEYPINFYPVFIPYSDANLGKASSHFCQDSLKKRRKDTGELVVQVSSFTSKEKAIYFAVFIRSEFENSMVGEPTVIEEKPF